MHTRTHQQVTWILIPFQMCESSESLHFFGLDPTLWGSGTGLRVVGLTVHFQRVCVRDPQVSLTCSRSCCLCWMYCCCFCCSRICLCCCCCCCCFRAAATAAWLLRYAALPWLPAIVLAPGWAAMALLPGADGMLLAAPGPWGGAGYEFWSYWKQWTSTFQYRWVQACIHVYR